MRHPGKRPAQGQGACSPAEWPPPASPGPGFSPDRRPSAVGRPPSPAAISPDLLPVRGLAAPGAPRTWARAAFVRFTRLPSPGMFPGLTRAAAGVRLGSLSRGEDSPLGADPAFAVGPSVDAWAVSPSWVLRCSCCEPRRAAACFSQVPGGCPSAASVGGRPSVTSSRGRRGRTQKETRLAPQAAPPGWADVWPRSIARPPVFTPRERSGRRTPCFQHGCHAPLAVQLLPLAAQGPL